MEKFNECVLVYHKSDYKIIQVENFFKFYLDFFLLKYLFKIKTVKIYLVNCVVWVDYYYENFANEVF